MKSPGKEPVREFENRQRLEVMSVLVVNDKVSFTTLRDLLQITDGNLASQLAVLEKAEYIKVKKQFIGRKPNTTYSATREGKKAFTDHLNYLENFLKNNK